MGLLDSLMPMLAAGGMGATPQSALPGTAQQQGALSPFYDADSLAQLQSDQLAYQRRNQLAQTLMSQGYAPNSGRFGVFAGIASMLGGKLAQDQNDSKLSDIVRRQFEAAQQAEAAKHAQERADQTFKTDEDIRKDDAGNKSKLANAPYAYAANLGAMDPRTGQVNIDPNVQSTILGQKEAEAKIAAANRAPPEIYAKVAMAQKLGATPDQIKQMLIGASGENGMPIPLGNQGASGEEYLKSLDPTQGAQIKALAEGRMAFPTGAALKSPYWQSMLQGVSQYDPSFEAANYGARAATRKDFTSGKAAQTINALNTVSGHLGDLSDAADKLDNFGGVLTPLNTVRNAALNASGDPRIKTFEANRKAAVDELTRVYRGTGGSEGDIKTWTDAMSSADSPEQLQTVIGQVTGLLNSKRNALMDQYKQGMGTIASQQDFTSPTAKAALERVQKRSGVSLDLPEGEATPAATPTQTAVNPKTGQRIGLVDGQWIPI